MRRDHDEMLRRGLDGVVAAVLLLALAPLLGLIALLVRATSRGPALFSQERIGKDGAVFRLLKFRTMVADAPARGPAVTANGDPRITRVGGLLRRWKLDELPQLANVLRGDMSLVGPRPEVPCYVTRYTPAQRRILCVRPGITDPATLAFVDEAGLLAGFADPERAYVEAVLPRKLELSLAYLDHRSVGTDLRVLARTAFRLLSPGTTAAPPA